MSTKKNAQHSEEAPQASAPVPEQITFTPAPQVPTVPQPSFAAPMPAPMAGLSGGSSGTKGSSTMAVLGLILGIIGFLLPLFSLPALIVSIFGIKQTADDKKTGRGMAIAGLVLSILGLLAAVFWAIVITAAILSPKPKSYDTTYTGLTTSSTKSTEQIKGTVKTPLVADKYTLTVNSVTHGFKSANSYDTPAAGNEYVVVSVTLKNTSSSSLYFTAYDFSIRDLDGSEHSNEYISDLPSEFSYKTTGPGTEMTGNIVFEVPLHATGESLIYSPIGYTGQEAKVTL